MTTRTHDLKSWPQFFRPIACGERTHELRRNDRDYGVGDRVLLREYDPSSDSYTGSYCEAVVTSITSRDVPCAASDLGLHPDYCILSIRLQAVSPDLRPASGSIVGTAHQPSHAG